MTNAEFVGLVIEPLKLDTADESPSRRAILARGLSISEYLISQKLSSPKFSFRDSLYTYFGCVELIDVPVVDCGIPMLNNKCRSMKRTKDPVPKILENKIFSTFRNVFNVDGTKEVTHVANANEWFKFKKHPAMKKQYKHVYFKRGGYLYFPDLTWAMVSYEAMVLNPEDAANADCTSDSSCNNFWDSEFACPPELTDAVLGKVIQQYASFTTLRQDEAPDNDTTSRVNRKEN